MLLKETRQMTLFKLSYIGAAVDGTTRQNWIPNIPTLLQAALGPLIASASDLFQARKWILIGKEIQRCPLTRRPRAKRVV